MSKSVDSEQGSDLYRLHRLLSTGELVHPFLAADHFESSHRRWDDRNIVASFTDLAHALAICCGAPLGTDDSVAKEVIPIASPHYVPSAERTRRCLAKEIGGGMGDPVRRHIIFILCDGMGNNVMERHLQRGESFLLERNDPKRLRAVFPSTTPAALTTLATAAWPGQHGMPGWDLQDKRGCDFPGMPAENPVQLRVLADRIADVRSGRPASELGFDSWNDIFVAEPWARSAKRACGAKSGGVPCHRRRMIYVNAYNGDDFPSWYQGQVDMKPEEDCVSDGDINKSNEEVCTDHSSKGSSTEPHHKSGTDFSSWQMGALGAENKTPETLAGSSWFEAAHIGETSYHTLGQPEGSHDAVRFFRDGVNTVIDALTAADARSIPTFTYLYTSHPDKHMHALGVDHPEVGNVVRGIDREIERLWKELGHCRQAKATEVEGSSSDKERVPQRKRLDASIIVTADHGHVTVRPEEMVLLPQEIVDCLEYANLGVHGKGRHAYLHCRSGLHSTLRKLWKSASESLSERFLLLTIEEAAEAGLFGPNAPVPKVRPRMGDFVAISTGPYTLVSPKEALKYQHACPALCQGAHGSLLPAEMNIPFVLSVPTPG